jgi:hypothetical protein
MNVSTPSNAPLRNIETLAEKTGRLNTTLEARLRSVETTVKNLVAPSVNVLNTCERYVEGRFDTHIEAFHSHQMRNIGSNQDKDT